MSDKKKKSIWLDDVRYKYPALDKDIKADVAVIGGGVSGCTAAYLLSQSGLKVVLLEADFLGCSTTGHTTAHITSQHSLIYKRWTHRFGSDTARLIAKANEDSIKMIKNIIEKEKIDCEFRLVNSYLYATTAQEVKKITDEYDCLKNFPIDCELTDRAEFIFPYKLALKYNNQAEFHPVKYIKGLAECIIKYKGEIYENSRVTKIENNKVITNKAGVTADHIVVATHYPVINLPGMYFAKIYQDRSYNIALKNTPRVTDLWMSAAADGFSFRMYQDLLIIGGPSHKTGLKQTTNYYNQLENFASIFFPDSIPAYYWSAQDGFSIDGLPYIGRYSEKTPDIYIATAYYKWGMTQGTLAGMIISDLIKGKQNEYADVYSPMRKKVASAYLGLIYVNASTALHYFTGLFKINQPKCAHMKCRLNYNINENSWDCPCHGSRFDKKGKVLDTPAIHDIPEK